MSKPSNLRWGYPSTSCLHTLYGDCEDFLGVMRICYPVGTVSHVGDSYHAYVRLAMYEPVQFMADFPTQEEAMAFVNTMVGSIEHG